MAEEREVWLYAAIDIDSKVVLPARFSEHRGTDLATSFLRELKEKLRVEDAEFLVDGMDYLTALAKADLSGHLDYTNHNIVEKLFQTFTMRIGLSRNLERQSGQRRALADCLRLLLQPSPEPPSA